MRGKYNEALQVLKRADQACSESVLEDGGTEEEAKEEAAIIRYKLYLLHVSGLVKRSRHLDVLPGIMHAESCPMRFFSLVFRYLI